MRWKLALILFLIGLATVSCSFFPGGTRSLTLQVDRDAFSAYLKQVRTSFDCYFVSVSGAGISPDFGPLNLGSRSPSCLGLGMTSNLLSYEELTGKGTKIRITAGSNRLVRILGVNSNANGGVCAGLPLASIFGTFRPAIFEVASTTTDAFVDRKIVVSGNPDLASTSDIVAPCDNTGGEDAPPSDSNLVASGSYLAVLVGTGSTQRRLRTYRVEPSTLELVDPVTYDATSAGGNTIKATPNGSHVFLFNAAISPIPGMSFKRYASNGKGGFLSTTANDQTIAETGTKLSFSADSKVAYVTYNKDLLQRTIGTTVLEPLGVGTCGITQMSLTFGAMFTLSAVLFPDSETVARSSIRSTGDVCAEPGVISPSHPNSVAANTNMARLHPSGVFYHINLVPDSSNYFLTTYQADATGRWSAAFGQQLELSNVSPPIVVSEMYLDRERKYIALVGNAGLMIRLIRLNDDGSIRGLGGYISISSIPFGELAFDSKSKAFYAIRGSNVVGYKIEDDGEELEEISMSILPTPETTTFGIQNVPVF